ncbi:MAG: ABC transporter permease [Gammaproteobacteria bacterium]
MSAERPLHEQYFGHDHVTVIEPSRGWRSLDFQELWAYRELLWVLTERDVRVRYAQTSLGMAWAVLQPLLLMVVFTIFFGRLAKVPSDGLPYPLFAYSALLPWVFFSSALTSSANSVAASAQLISKVYFPRLIIPLASVGSWLVDFLVALTILLGLMAYYRLGWTLNLLWLPALLAVLVFAALGIGTFLAALTASYRDVRHVVPFVLQVWMFATPIVYPASLVPTDWRWLLNLNPMTGLIEAFRAAFVGRPVDVASLGVSVAVAIMLFVVGVAYFERVQRRFADIV